jgi:hypothetical protein
MKLDWRETMTKDSRQITQDVWKQKSDEELLAASEDFSVYTEEAEEIIRAEMRRRRDMPEPAPIVRTVGDEQSGQPISSSTNNRIVMAIGMVSVVIGVALIIISPKLLFVEHVPGGFLNLGMERITDLRSVSLFFGVAALIVGGIISAVGFVQFSSTQPTTPPAPTSQPVVSQSASPKSIELGNTPDEVQSVMGQPDKIINLGARVIHVYEDMKIIYVEGKVADVQ